MHTRNLAMVALLASTALGTAVIAAENTSATGTDGNEAANSAATGVEATPGAGEDGSSMATQAGDDDVSRPTDDMMTQRDSDEVYRSMNNEADTFQGAVGNDLSVEDLMGREVVDVTGEHVGEVSDLLIASDDTVSKAIVDVGGFLGIGEKTVAVDLNEIELEQGAGGALVIDITKEQAEALPEYEESDDGWRMM